MPVRSLYRTLPDREKITSHRSAQFSFFFPSLLVGLNRKVHLRACLSPPRPRQVLISVYLTSPPYNSTMAPFPFLFTLLGLLLLPFTSTTSPTSLRSKRHELEQLLKANAKENLQDIVQDFTQCLDKGEEHVLEKRRRLRESVQRNDRLKPTMNEKDSLPHCSGPLVTDDAPPAPST